MFLQITDKPFCHPEFATYLTDPGHGAQTVFLGRVRDLNHGRKVVAVSYDLFFPLAHAVFTEIAREALAQWGTSMRLGIFHRMGRLDVGEVSVAIGVSSPHRDEAYQASRFVIENIKHRAPIWKKEHYEDGETEWLKGHSLCGHGVAQK